MVIYLDMIDGHLLGYYLEMVNGHIVLLGYGLWTPTWIQFMDT